MQVPEVRQTAYRFEQAEIGRPDEYDRAKRILNRGKHPTFVGRQTVERYAREGGMTFFKIDGKDVGVAMVAMTRSVLMVLNVVPEFRGTQVGTSILTYLKVNFVRAVESAVPWFEARGYKPVGSWKQGRSLRTRVMVRSNLISLAGRLRRALAK